MAPKYEEITFTIAADGGSVQIEAEGFVGSACKAATRPYENALGVITSDTDTPEMKQAEVKARATKPLDADVEEGEYEEVVLYISADGQRIEHIDHPIATAITAELGTLRIERASDIEFKSGTWQIMFRNWIDIELPTSVFAPADRVGALRHEVEILRSIHEQREFFSHAIEAGPDHTDRSGVVEEIRPEGAGTGGNPPSGTEADD